MESDVHFVKTHVWHCFEFLINASFLHFVLAHVNHSIYLCRKFLRSSWCSQSDVRCGTSRAEYVVSAVRDHFHGGLFRWATMGAPWLLAAPALITLLLTHFNPSGCANQMEPMLVRFSFKISSNSSNEKIVQISTLDFVFLFNLNHSQLSAQLLYLELV